MSRKEIEKRNNADWASPELFKADEDQTNGTEPSPLSDADRHRLLREWTDANTRGDDQARRRVEDKILGRPSQEEPLQVRTRSPQHDGSSVT